MKTKTRLWRPIYHNIDIGLQDKKAIATRFQDHKTTTLRFGGLKHHEIRGTKTPCIEKQRTETTIWRDFRDSITFFTKYKTYFSYTIILLFYIIILSCKEVRPSFLRNKLSFKEIKLSV